MLLEEAHSDCRSCLFLHWTALLISEGSYKLAASSSEGSLPVADPCLLLQALLYVQGVQQAHAVTLTHSFMQSGGIRFAKDYILDPGVGGTVGLTTSGPSTPQPMPASGSWEDIDQQTIDELHEMAGVSHTLKGE